MEYIALDVVCITVRLDRHYPVHDLISPGRNAGNMTRGIVSSSIFLHFLLRRYGVLRTSALFTAAFPSSLVMVPK